MRVLVIGAGAIGGYVGAKLALDGHAVTFVGRQPLADAAASGLHLIEPGRQLIVKDCRVATSIRAAMAGADRFDLALFTVKTYDTCTAIDELRPHAERVDRCLSLQNGVSSEELLGEALGRDKIIAGTILNPVSTPAPGAVMLEKRRGGIGIASLRVSAPANQPTDPPADEPTLQHSNQLCHAGFTVRTYADYRAMKWSKLLLNLIANASCAILDLNSMQAFADPRVFAIEIAALRETIRVARAGGIRFVDLPGYPVTLLAAALRFMPLWLLQPVLRPMVSGGRGQKMPSLWMDLSGGKDKSEIDDLNGAVVRAGAQLRIATPANAVLTDTLNDVLSGRTARVEWRHRADRLWAMYDAAVRRC